MHSNFRAGRPIFPLWLCAAFLGSCVGQTAHSAAAETPERFVILPEQVRLAMAKRSWSPDKVQIHLAASVTASVAAPVLAIQSITLRPGHEAMLQIACATRAECLPFFATASWPADIPMPDLGEHAAKAISARPGSDLTMSQAEPSSPSAETATGATIKPATIRVGSPATLLLEGDRVHITLRVFFAQSGRVGDTVRVTSPDRKQVYVAEVLTPELLKGQIKP